MNIICKSVFSGFLLVVLAGCMSQAPVKKVATEPERLVVYADGTMEFRNRKIDPENVVIYKDGRGGEKAAMKMSLEPLHPPFYRDTIVVVRKPSDS